MTIEQLQKFCGTDETRVKLSKPFTVGKFTYATDGMKMVRVPKVEGAIGNVGHPSNPYEAFPKEIGVEITLPKFPAPKKEECDNCGGWGKIGSKSKHHECEECDGTGTIQITIPIEVNHQKFSDVFLSEILTLPGVKFFQGKSWMDVLYFKFTGGDGVLMPRRKN